LPLRRAPRALRRLAPALPSPVFIRYTGSAANPLVDASTFESENKLALEPLSPIRSAETCWLTAVVGVLIAATSPANDELGTAKVVPKFVARMLKSTELIVPS